MDNQGDVLPSVKQIFESLTINCSCYFLAYLSLESKICIYIGEIGIPHDINLTVMEDCSNNIHCTLPSWANLKETLHIFSPEGKRLLSNKITWIIHEQDKCCLEKLPFWTFSTKQKLCIHPPFVNIVRSMKRCDYHTSLNLASKHCLH